MMEAGKLSGRPIGKRPRSLAQQAQQLAAIELARQVQSDRAAAELMASLGTGGFLTRRSSPVLFWLADRIDGADHG